MLRWALNKNNYKNHSDSTVIITFINSCVCLWMNPWHQELCILCVLPHIFEPKHQRPTIINYVARSTPLPIGTLCAYEHFGWNIIIGHHHHQQHQHCCVLCVCAYEHFRVNFKQYFGTRTSSPTVIAQNHFASSAPGTGCAYEHFGRAYNLPVLHFPAAEVSSWSSSSFQPIHYLGNHIVRKIKHK